jgi:hypothetical protein
MPGREGAPPSGGSCGDCFNRQAEADHAALPRAALHLDRAAEGPNQLPADGQPEAGVGMGGVGGDGQLGKG